MKKFVLTAMVLILAGCAPDQPDQSLEVSKTMQINASLGNVWEYAGDFCAIDAWHPAVAECEITEENGSTFRVLTLGDGALIKEKHDGDQPNGYMYSVVEGPLPVKDYNATFVAEGNDDGTMITWTATFLAEGATDDEAKDVISGVFDGGLASIRDNFE